MFELKGKEISSIVQLKLFAYLNPSAKTLSIKFLLGNQNRSQYMQSWYFLHTVNWDRISCLTHVILPRLPCLGNVHAVLLIIY